MDYLRTFAEEYGLKDIIAKVVEHPNVLGAILTLDELWLISWRYTEIGRDVEWENFVRMWDRMRYNDRYCNYYMGTDKDMSSSWIPRQRPDLQWRPQYWDHVCHMRGYSSEMLPIWLIICLRPSKSGEKVEAPELPQFRLPVRFEVRPIARLSTSQRLKARPVVGGVSVGTGTSLYGTLGGIVKDQTGQHYGMTCAHVFPSPISVDQPARYDDAQATAIGMSTKSITLQPCPGGGPCNPYTNSPHISSVDTTLVEFDSSIASNLEILSIGPLAGIVDKNSMTPGQEVTFEGRSSGYRITEVGGLALFYRFQIKGQTYCFRDLFEIRWPSLVRSVFGPVVQAGDSGAWVCAETDRGPGWCGQIIGEDRRTGYVAFAENIVDAWSNAGKKLCVE